MINVLTDQFWEAFRFWSKVDFSGDCWRWLAHIDRSTGYARVNYRRKARGAHRVAYALRYGRFPQHLTIDHVKVRGCLFRDCQNTSHMEVVTNEVNASRADAWQSRKTHCPQGHEYTPENTYKLRNGFFGFRQCVTCTRARSAASYLRQRNAKVGVN